MVEARLLEADETRPDGRHEMGALDLARRLPSLLVAAKDVAATVMHGVHGRRRAGVGETFWQFRPFVMGESISRIDWRRSARDDRVYVREREWEAAHTIWLWMDLSQSMAYVSNLALQSKLDRALVLGLASADLLVRGGERVGLIGLTRPVATRNIIERLAEALVQETGRPDYVAAELPADQPLAPRTQAILISDFLTPAEKIRQTIQAMASRGAQGHLVMIADPVEETFPFTGHTEFRDVDSSATLRVGEASLFRKDYVNRLAAHRDAIKQVCLSRGWSFTLHRTDRPASEALLGLRMQIESGQSFGSYGGAQ